MARSKARTWSCQVQQLSAAVVLATAALSCAASAPNPVARPRISTRVEALEPGAELTLGQPCSRVGLETCFNAIDDDCNGLVDEGCGLPSGVLQIVAAWDAPDADVNLVVTDPKGERVAVGRYTSLGLTKDRDCPGPQDECSGQNFEVVTCAASQLPVGRYRVELVLDRLPLNRTDVKVAIGGHWGQQHIRGKLVLSANKPNSSVVFLSEVTAVRTRGAQSPGFLGQTPGGVAVAPENEPSASE